MKRLYLTGDRPLKSSDCRKLKSYWQASGWSCDVTYVFTTHGGTRLFTVVASR